MLSILRNPAFGRLFSAQVVALVGTGLLTVALGLLAYDLAGPRAASVLGLAYVIKMVAYVGLSPVFSALFARLPRRRVLVAADLVRAGVALSLPFITEVWQIYLAIFVLQSASASFTPAFQATIPDVLPDEDDYTRALSLSRLAYDLENLISPALAGLLLLVVSYHWLFAGTALGFALSALLVVTTRLPTPIPTRDRPFHDRLTRGVRIYLATPRLRGMLALVLTAASASAFVIVDTVVLVRDTYNGSEADVATALAAFGAGSMFAAIALPRLLRRTGDRPVMLIAAAALAGLLAMHGIWQSLARPDWIALLVLWAAFGIAYAAILTPSGRLLRRSSAPDDRAALFTAHFALSHVCWLIAYPIAGSAMTRLGPAPTLLILAALAFAGLLAALYVWPRAADGPLPHSHPDLPASHPHLRAYGQGAAHAHAIVLDDEHRVWPTHG